MLRTFAIRLATRSLYFLLAQVTLLALSALSAAAQSGGQYRAFWVDTFNTALNNHNDIVAVVNNTKAANCNAIFAQVRQRGDSWYLNSLEPPADRQPLAEGFDPLQDLINEAHASGIEVHAFVVVTAIWNSDPRVRPPVAANHVFNLHGLDPATGNIREGRDNWLTRTLLPDQTASDGSQLISYGGYRIGSLFSVDLGHPDAASYTVDVLMHLVRNYDIDGLHLDRIRYPELSIGGQTPQTGANIGYNETNVQRFQRRYGLDANSVPAANDTRWSQWRRDQVTNIVRRIYLNAIAIKPRLIVSAALIAFGGGPTTEDSWRSAEAYWRVYQDWRAWTEEGILDIVIPMNYKTEHTTTGRSTYDQWNEWTKNHAYNRATMIGQGAFLNSIEGTLRQTRRALAPSSSGNTTSGVIFFSMATSNVAVTANPFSIPPGQNTPRRSFAEFASGLTTGKSVDRAITYEDAATNPTPVFSAPAAIPKFSWKTNPQVGHVMGVIRNERDEVVDAGDVVISRVEDGIPVNAGRTSVSTATDGNGFYGGVDLAPGTYRVTVTPTGQASYTTTASVEIVAGRVSQFDALIDRSSSNPASTTLQFSAAN